MKKITLFTLFILLNVFAISSTYAAEVEVPIPSGTGLVWTLLDFEASGSITSHGFNAPAILAGTNWAGTAIARPANPKSDAVNSSGSCWKWIKNNGAGNFGSIAFTTNVLDKYYDLSKWQSLSFDIYMASEALTKLKVQLVDQTTTYNTTTGIASKNYTYPGTTYPGGSWYTITINFSDLSFENGFTDLTRVNGFMLYINNELGTTGTTTDVYVDNYRLNRDQTTKIDNLKNGNFISIIGREIILADEISKVEIYNSTGRLINSFVGMNKFTLNNAGMYIIKATKNGSDLFQKIIIQ